MNRLKDKTILITGASSGIGKAAARAFAAQGSKLILAARREQALVELKNELTNEFDSKIYIHALDVREKQQVDQFFGSIPDEFISIDVLLNNAGLALGLSHTIDSSIADWEDMINTNIKGLVYVTRATLELMYPLKRGHIINLGSIAGIDYYANGSVYCATKAAVHAFSGALREECVEKNIKVSEILPGMVNTEFSKVRFHGDIERADNVYKGVEPLVAEDLADLIAYMANLPAHVNLSETVIMPTCQANAHKTFRE